MFTLDRVHNNTSALLTFGPGLLIVDKFCARIELKLRTAYYEYYYPCLRSVLLMCSTWGT